MSTQELSDILYRRITALIDSGNTLSEGGEIAHIFP
jgi:hypothetical protein